MKKILFGIALILFGFIFIYILGFVFSVVGFVSHEK